MVPDDYVWLNPKTGSPFGDINRAFISVSRDAGIEGWSGVIYGLPTARGWAMQVSTLTTQLSS